MFTDSIMTYNLKLLITSTHNKEVTKMKKNIKMVETRAERQGCQGRNDSVPVHWYIYVRYRMHT